MSQPRVPKATALAIVATFAMALPACENDSGVQGYNAMVAHVEHHRVGEDSDQWIEMRNMSGEWERTGVIFGYIGDYEECVKAIAGLKQANPLRDYRCVPAN